MTELSKLTLAAAMALAVAAASARAEPNPVTAPPEDGEKGLTDAELKSMPADFLEQALIERTKQGPVRWDMWVTIGEPGDPEIDPTLLWPKDRKEVKAGTLTLSSAMPQEGAPCKDINYDPLVMSDGIAPTDDPVLLFRSPSYAVSSVKPARPGIPASKKERRNELCRPISRQPRSCHERRRGFFSPAPRRPILS